MATLELEPDFVKGLKFMFSTSKDAPDALRAMLDDAIRAKYGSSKSLGTFQHKVKMEEEIMASHIVTERNSEESCSSNDDDGEGELNMMDLAHDLACKVCSGMNVGPRNRLVECQECGKLYHQECHHPPISDQDISDPRNTWYCATCSRSMHRPTETPAASSSSSSSKQSSSSKSSSKQPFKSSGQSSSSRDSPTNSKSSSSSRSESSEKSSLFKRADKTSSSSSSNSGNHKSAPAGLAALAASLQNPKSSSSGSGSSSHKSSSGFSSGSGSSSKNSSSSKEGYSSSSSKNFSSSGSSSNQSSKNAPSSPTLSGLNADRRLQIMKKKAAKMQEKRKHSK